MDSVYGKGDHAESRPRKQGRSLFDERNPEAVPESSVKLCKCRKMSEWSVNSVRYIMEGVVK